MNLSNGIGIVFLLSGLPVDLAWGGVLLQDDVLAQVLWFLQNKVFHELEFGLECNASDGKWKRVSKSPWIALPVCVRHSLGSRSFGFLLESFILVAGPT